MKLLTFILVFILDIIPSGEAYLKQLQQRDSVLVADQVEYGFALEGIKNGTSVALQDLSELSNDTLVLVRNWQFDTLNVNKKKQLMDLRGSVVLAPFEEGVYELPPILVQRTYAGKVDTLLFEGVRLEVATIPVDTATFEIRDIKGQIKYPVTFKEVFPWLGGFILLLALVAVVIYLVIRYRRRKGLEPSPDEPAYIVALRRLEHFRNDKFWTPEKQKGFYSGVTDALKEYIEDRFGVDAPEMTTEELFSALKNRPEIAADVFESAKDLFERADFVKFAKYVASDEDNARVIPTAINLVTSTIEEKTE
ncbi:MAG: hypothetical protein MJY53_02910 [Bacteroidales bacterium]|nr:hypothetical protein [Bacteroidales bacterium]